MTGGRYPPFLDLLTVFPVLPQPSQLIFLPCLLKLLLPEGHAQPVREDQQLENPAWLYQDRKNTRLNSSHVRTSYAVFCLKKKNRRDRASRRDEEHAVTL